VDVVDKGLIYVFSRDVAAVAVNNKEALLVGLCWPS